MSWFTAWNRHPESVAQLSPRDRRLAADARAISSLVAESSIFRADGKGSPPSQYRFRFSGKGLALDPFGKVIVQQEHEVWVELGAAYPRLMPALQWKTPIFHPNISVNGIVCLGGYGTHWVPSLTLDALCCMIWDMIRMKNFDIASPYNREAAAWLREQNGYLFPLDPRPLRDRLSTDGLGAGQDEPSETRTSRPHESVEVIESGIEVVGLPKSMGSDDIVFID